MIRIYMQGMEETAERTENGYFRFKDGTELNFYEIDALGGYFLDGTLITELRKELIYVERTGHVEELQRILERYRQYHVPAEFKRILGLLTDSEQGRHRLFNHNLPTDSPVKVVRRWDKWDRIYVWTIRTCGVSISRKVIKAKEF